MLSKYRSCLQALSVRPSLPLPAFCLSRVSHLAPPWILIDAALSQHTQVHKWWNPMDFLPPLKPEVKVKLPSFYEVFLGIYWSQKWLTLSIKAPGCEKKWFLLKASKFGDSFIFLWNILSPSPLYIRGKIWLPYLSALSAPSSFLQPYFIICNKECPFGSWE